MNGMKISNLVSDDEENSAIYNQTDFICTNLDNIVKSISSLKTEIVELQRIRNQSVIALKQYNDENNILAEFIRQYKFSYVHLNFDLNSQLKGEELQESFQTIVNPKNDPQEHQTDTTLNSKASTLPNDHPLAGFSSSTGLHHVLLNHSVELDSLTDPNHYPRQRYSIQTDSVLCALSFNSNGSLFAIADGKTAYIIDTTSGDAVSFCDIPNITNQEDPHTRALAFSPDSRYLIVSGLSNSIIVIDIKASHVISILNGHSDTAPALAFTNDSKTLISGGFDGKIIMWNMSTFSISRIIEVKQSINSLTNDSSGKTNVSDERSQIMIIGIEITHDQKFIIVGFISGKVAIYEPTFTQPPKTFTAHNDYLLAISISPKDDLIVTSSHDKTVKVWNFGDSITLKNTLVGHTDYVLSACCSYDEKFIFSGSKDETINCWDIDSGELLYTLKVHKNTVFQIDLHPSENTFISCSADHYASVWDY